MQILGKYKITYDNGISQQKNLVSHDDYENIIKPKQKEAYEFELKKKDKEANTIKRELVNMFGEYWFTDKSPLALAIHTGIVDNAPWMDAKYNYNVKFEKIDV